MSEIRVFIADDHAVLRSGLKLLINTQSDMKVVGEAGDIVATRAKVLELRPDVLTLDLSMPGGDALGEISYLAKNVAETRILVLTMHDDVSMFQLAIGAGAAGYLVKSAADTELLTAIRTVAAGRPYMSLPGRDRPTIPETGHSEDAHDQKALDTLSAREREVLTLLAQGHTNQSIADRLFLSVKTIESYRSRLMAKLELSTRADLTRFALQFGLLKSDS